jgi:hypothetical protein
MKGFQLFIGANNDTKQVELEKIQQTLDQYFEGYTITQANGRWQGSNEPSVVVDLTLEDDSMLQTAMRTLNEVLNQDAIGWRESAPLMFETSRV